MTFMVKKRIPVACTATPVDAAAQLGEWAEVRASATAIEPLPNGVALSLPIDQHERVDDLAGREAMCCAFLSFATTVVDGRLRLEITTDDPNGVPVADLLAGAPRR